MQAWKRELQVCFSYFSFKLVSQKGIVFYDKTLIKNKSVETKFVGLPAFYVIYVTNTINIFLLFFIALFSRSTGPSVLFYVSSYDAIRLWGVLE